MDGGLGGILTSAILGIVTLVFSSKWRSIPAWGRFGVILIGILTLVSGYFSWLKYHQDKIIERVNAKIGAISDKGVTDTVVLHIGPGEGVTKFKLLDGHFNFTPEPISPNPVYWFEIKNGKIIAYGTVRDFEGKPIAVISNNEWKVFSDDYEYQNNDHAVELVTKGDRKVIFQLYLKDGIAIFQGLVVNDLGSGMYFYKVDTGGSGALKFTKEEPINNALYVSSNAKPIFVYPRETHLGEMVSQ